MLEAELAKIKPLEYQDVLTEQTLAVTVSPYYAVLHIDDRQYYFKRETGEFDGTSF